MKTVLCIAGFVVLLTSTGCVVHEHERYRGGYYGHREYHYGRYRSGPPRFYSPRYYHWHDGYWDGRDYRYYR